MKSKDVFDNNEKIYIYFVNQEVLPEDNTNNKQKYNRRFSLQVTEKTNLLVKVCVNASENNSYYIKF